MHLAVTKHIVQSRQRFRSTGEDNKASHRTVKPVNYTKEYGTRFSVLLLDVLLHRLRQRLIASLITLHYLTTLFVDDDDMIILIDHSHNDGEVTYFFSIHQKKVFIEQ